MTAETNEWWRSLGELRDLYEIPMLNPFDPSYPAWPSDGRRLRLLRTAAGAAVVTTDGLGGPELPEYFVESGEVPVKLSGWWAANLLLEIGRFVPRNPEGIAAMLAQAGVASMAIEMDGAPADWTTTDGGIGVFLGLPHPYTGGRSLVSVKLMRPAELAYSAAHRADGRAELRRRYERQGGTCRSDLDRDSVI